MNNKHLISNKNLLHHFYRDRGVSVFIYFPAFALDVKTSFKLKLANKPRAKKPMIKGIFIIYYY